MHNPVSVQENDTHKLLWDFDIQMDHLISTRRQDLIIINKKKRKSAKLSTYCLGRPQNETDRMWKEIITLTLLENWKKLWNMKVTIIPIVVGAFGTITKGLLMGLEDF